MVLMMLIFFMFGIWLGESFQSSPFQTSRWVSAKSSLSLGLGSDSVDVPSYAIKLAPEPGSLGVRVFQRNNDTEYYELLDQYVKSTWSANAIGSSITANQTAEILSTGLTIGGLPTIEFRDILAHANAIDWVKQQVQDNVPFSKHFFDSLNTLLTSHVPMAETYDANGTIHKIPCQSGEYRKIPLFTKLDDGTMEQKGALPEQIEKIMPQFIDFCNNPPSTMHPVEMAAWAHYHYLRISPYHESNLQISHLLMGYFLFKIEIAPAIILKPDWPDYEDALFKGDFKALVRVVDKSIRQFQDSIPASILARAPMEPEIYPGIESKQCVQAVNQDNSTVSDI